MRTSDKEHWYHYMDKTANEESLNGYWLPAIEKTKKYSKWVKQADITKRGYHKEYKTQTNG